MDALTHRKAVLHSIQCFFGARRSESSRRTMRVLNARAQLCWFIMSLNSGTQVLIHHILLPKLYNLEQVMFTNNEGLCQIAGNCSRLAWITIALPNWGFAYALCPLLWPQPWIVDTILIDSLEWLPRINVITKVTMVSLFIDISKISVPRHH